MKVLISITGYFPPYGGAEQYAFNLSRELAAAGHDPRILTFSATGDAMPFLTRIAWPGKSVIRLRVFFSVLFREVREADVVYANYSDELSLAVSLASLLFRRPVFNFAHGNGIILTGSAGPVRRLIRFLTLRCASGVIATSEEIAVIARRYASRVIVATAIDVRRIRDGVSAQRVAAIRASFSCFPLIVTVRRLVEKNGIQYLIAAMPEIVRRMPRAACIIVGAGAFETDLRQYASLSGYGNKIYFCGERTGSELYSYIAAADVVVFPSSAEALSLACLEVMALRRPAVVSAVGGLIELAGPNDMRAVSVSLFGRHDSRYDAPAPDTIDPSAYRGFSRAIKKAVDVRSNGARLRAAADFVDTYHDWSHVARRIMSFSGISCASSASEGSASERERQSPAQEA